MYEIWLLRLLELSRKANSIENNNIAQGIYYTFAKKRVFSHFCVLYTVLVGNVCGCYFMICTFNYYIMKL